MVVSAILDTNMTFVRPKRLKTPIPTASLKTPIHARTMQSSVPLLAATSHYRIFDRKSTIASIFAEPITYFVGVLRGNTIRGKTTRNSERRMAL